MEQQRPSTATLTRRVEWVDTDASGHHHHSLIMRLVEQAEHRLIRDAGILEDYFSAAPRVRQEVDFTAPLAFGQEVTVTVVCERVGRSSVTFAFEVWGEAHAGEPRRRAASGRVVAAHVPAGAERALPWPDHLRAALVPRAG
nr:acyl-CoA thioesterase [Propionibacterium sp.]